MGARLSARGRAHITRTVRAHPTTGGAPVDFGRCRAPTPRPTLGRVDEEQRRRAARVATPLVAAGVLATAFGEYASGLGLLIHDADLC